MVSYKNERFSLEWYLPVLLPLNTKKRSTGGRMAASRIFDFSTVIYMPSKSSRFGVLSCCFIANLQSGSPQTRAQLDDKWWPCPSFLHGHGSHFLWEIGSLKRSIIDLTRYPEGCLSARTCLHPTSTLFVTTTRVSTSHKCNKTNKLQS